MINVEVLRTQKDSYHLLLRSEKNGPIQATIKIDRKGLKELKQLIKTILKD